MAIKDVTRSLKRKISSLYSHLLIILRFCFFQSCDQYWCYDCDEDVCGSFHMKMIMMSKPIEDFHPDNYLLKRKCMEKVRTR